MQRVIKLPQFNAVSDYGQLKNVPSLLNMAEYVNKQLCECSQLQETILMSSMLINEIMNFYYIFQLHYKYANMRKVDPSLSQMVQIFRLTKSNMFLHKVTPKGLFYLNIHKQT